MIYWLVCRRIYFTVTLLDIDECQDGNNSCDINAGCSNTDGGYNCTCQHGYYGNGTICTGISYYTCIIQSYFFNKYMYK